MKNRKFRDAIVSVVKEAGAEGGTNKSKGALLYEVAIKVCIWKSYENVSEAQ